MGEAQKGYPYDGAKEHYILDIEDKEFVKIVVTELLAVTAFPKPKKKKS
ncbi:MAG: hypothetical protein LBS29_03125 [Endomicrobium sp.]|jgi:hypothetical protein|nr:hypothetical protein [Endomicrobium sp.]